MDEEAADNTTHTSRTTNAVSQPKPIATSKDPIELTVQLLGLIVVVLPVVGIGIRAIAFAIGGVPSPIELAVKDSVQDLALTATKGTGLWTVSALLMGLALYKRWLPKRDSNRPAISRFALWSPLGFIAIVLAFLGDFPGMWIEMAGGLLAGSLLAVWEIQGRLTFYRMAAGVLVGALFAAIAAGLAGYGVGDEINAYTFDPALGMPDGTYVLLGKADGVSYLDSCKGTGVFGASDPLIRSIRPSPPSVGRYGTLVDDIFAHNPVTIGYLRLCGVFPHPIK